MPSDLRPLFWTGISVLATVIALLISAWAVEMSRRIETLHDRQRDVMVRVQALEQERSRRYPLGQ